MDSAIRRIIAVEAHKRRSGRYPTLIYSLGTGEAFEINVTGDGFFDVESSLAVRVEQTGLRLPRGGIIELAMVDDVTFAGYDYVSDEPFTGRAGGGASITVYGKDDTNYFQYAVAEDEVRNNMGQRQGQRSV